MKRHHFTNPVLQKRENRKAKDFSVIAFIPFIYDNQYVFLL